MTQRQEIIERLNGLEMEGGSHAMLSAICKAVLPHSGAWTLRMCEDLRDRLVRLLGEADAAPCGGRITDELREYISDMVTRGISPICEKSLAEIADHIDSVYERAIKSVMNDALYHANDKDMADLGWYKALDADKQPIKLGGDAEWELMGSGETERGRVVGIKIDLIADRQSCRVKVVRDSDFQTIELMAKNLHHVKPAEPEPTVEDVLREMADRIYADEDEPRNRDAIIAEYAAKLMLKED